MIRRNVIMLTGICLGLSILMMACQANPPDTSADHTSASETAATQETKENPTISPIQLPAAEQTQALKDKLSLTAGGDIVQFVCLDYDQNGTYEAFAIVGSQDTQQEDTYNGTLWFASDNETTPIGESSSYSYLERISIGDKYLLLVHKNFSFGSQSYVYGVKDGQAYEDEISGKLSGLAQTASGSFTAVQDAYDACTDGTGHTWKPYWFYYDNGFHEYGAIQLSLDILRTYQGSERTLQQIESEKGQIVNILYRENGIININYQTPWTRDGVDDYINNYFITLNYQDGTVTTVATDEHIGQYQEALMPDLATYPEKTP